MGNFQPKFSGESVGSVADSQSGLPLPLGSHSEAWLVLLGAALLVIRAVFAARFDLFPDEILYAWLWSHAPLNFCPHPSGTPLLAGLGMAIAGRTGLGVRFMSLVIGCITPLVMYALARSLGGRKVACWTALLFLATPMTFAFGAILTPDGTQFLFWATAMFFTWQALEGRGRNATLAWIAAGVTVGLGLHVKYMMILYFPSLALCLLTVPRWRRLWRTPGPWLCVGMAALIFAPLAIYTEAAQDWPTLRYHLVARQHGISPSWENILIYHGAHFGMYSPLLYPAMVGAMFVALVRGIRRDRPALVFVGWFAVFMWVFFTVICAVTERRLDREQWDAPAYVAAMVAVVLLANDFLISASSAQSRRRRLRMAAAIPAVGLFIIALASTDIFTGSITTLIGRRPLFRSIEGWREITVRADEEFARLPADKPSFLLSNRYSGALAYWFYGAENHPVYCLNHESAEQYGLTSLLQRSGVSQDHLLPEHRGENAVVLHIGEGKRKLLSKRQEQLSPWFESFPPPLDGGELERAIVFPALGFRDKNSTTPVSK